MSGTRPAPPALPWLLGLMAVFGFASGLPLPVSGFTLRQWLTEAGLPLPVIGLTAPLGLAYALKFVWAPLFDRPPPFGRGRRGWLLLLQPLLSAALLLLSESDPNRRPGFTLSLAAAIAFLSASQDMLIDAWRIAVFPPERQGMALASYVWGYRAALLVGGSLVIKIADLWGWRASLGLLALLSLAGLLTTLAAPEPPLSAPPGPSAAEEEKRTAGKTPPAWLIPLRDLLDRPRAARLLAFVALFKLGEAVGGVMLAPLYRHLGFDRAEVALANGPLSLSATVAGITFGGVLVSRLSLWRALVATGVFQAMTMAMYITLALSPGARGILYGTTVIEAFAEGLADAAFLAFLSSLCRPAYAATQYALLSSLAALPLRSVAGLSGWLANALGFVRFYAVAMGLGLPALLLLISLRDILDRPPRRNIPLVLADGDG